MRPAVYASVLRSRKPGARRIQQGDHTFSWRRFFMMVFAGAVLFIPGLIVTVLGLNSENIASSPEDGVLYKVIGPAAFACGIGIMCSSGIYYCCWGLKRPVRTNRHSSKHHLKDHSDEQTDPLHREATSTINTITTVGHAHISPASERSHSPVWDSPSIRHGSNNFNSTHPHRSSSKSSADGSMKGHHASRHRTASSSSHHHSHSHHHTKPGDNQVAFQSADAPLARGEASGSGDISIDMDGRLEMNKRI